MTQACYLCGSSDALTAVTLDTWSVLRCRTCSLGWLDPRPAESELSRAYEEEYFTRNSIMVADTEEQLVSKVAGQRSRARFVKRYKQSGTLLDIGCASGHFLAAARDAGYDARGLEISEWAVEEGRRRLSLDILQGSVETADFPAGSFDAVTMWHVVEHFDDPISSLKKVRRWLKPDGVLVVECPNSDSLDARRYGAEWAGWRIPYHLWHFTPRSFSTTLDRAGYEVLRVQVTPSRWVRERLKRLPLIGLFRKPISACFVGRDMRVVGRPVTE